MDRFYCFAWVVCVFLFCTVASRVGDDFFAARVSFLPHPSDAFYLSLLCCGVKCSALQRLPCFFKKPMYIPCIPGKEERRGLE